MLERSPAKNSRLITAMSSAKDIYGKALLAWQIKTHLKATTLKRDVLSIKRDTLHLKSLCIDNVIVCWSFGASRSLINISWRGRGTRWCDKWPQNILRPSVNSANQNISWRDINPAGAAINYRCGSQVRLKLQRVRWKNERMPPSQFKLEIDCRNSDVEMGMFCRYLKYAREGLLRQIVGLM